VILVALDVPGVDICLRQSDKVGQPR